MRRRRGIGVVGLVARTLLLFVLGAAVMLAALRFQLIPASVLGSAPAQTAVSLASTSAHGIAPAAATTLPSPAASPPGAATALATTVPSTPAAQLLPSPTQVKALAGDSARRYLQAWQQQRYPEMYRLLSAGARRTIAEDRFLARYQAITVGATVNSLKTTLAPFDEPAAGATAAAAKYSVAFQTARLGDFAEENALPLIFEENEWRVDWKPDLIFRELTADRKVVLIPDDPVRGAILDRNGQPLAAQGKIVTVGAVPGRIKNLEQAVAELAKLTGERPEAIRQKIQSAKPDWWVPFKDFPLDRREELTRRFASVEGVLAEEKAARTYPAGAVAAHVTGFIAPVTADDLKTLAARGYDEGDLVGKAGVEQTAEETLAGLRGGKLVIQDADGETVRTIAERPAKNGGTIRLSIDLDVQRKADQVLGDRTGSLVVMDPRDNSVLALVSKPAYDPNGFVFGLSDEDFKRLSDDKRQPFQARATLSTYPTGSVFKVITMAAGLERGGYKPNSQFQCNGQWGVKELNLKKPMGDWKPQGHGKLDLSAGLVQSCDIVFYELGNKLESIDSNILADYAHQFGLGEPTGIQGLVEAGGIVPNPDWKKRTLKEEWVVGDAVNMAIGQGYVDATPLQVANVYSTIANGGVLRAPLLIKSISPGDGRPSREFQAQERKRVSVSGQNLAAIRESLKKVATVGTASYAFANPPYRIPIAAKTGSAENQNENDHAWFAAFGPADAPTVVVTVMVEGGQHG
ncbi:MAG TPA: penicillin-binding protein 2, partial [Chloroflexota bacterium]